MPTTPKPLTKKQRDRAERARGGHAELLRLTGAIDRIRAARDANVVALLRDGVPPFVCENETGIPRSTLTHLVRQAKAAQ